MISYIKHISKMTLLIASIGFLSACNGSHKHDHPEEHGHEHEDSGSQITALTTEQIRTMGISWGPIEQKQLTAVIKANGHLRVPNDNQASVTTLFGGVVKSISVQVGDHVKKGQTIAIVENPQFVQLQEEYLTIRSKETFAEQEVARQRKLNEGGAGALKNVQDTEATLRSLRARKASLQKQLQLMGIDAARINIHNLQSAIALVSPIQGTISGLQAKIGRYIDPASSVAEIVDNTQLHLDLQVFEQDLPSLHVGQLIHFTLTNNPITEYDAKIYSIGSSFENDSKTIAVHATVTGNKSDLIDGMNVTGLVSMGRETRPAVPNEALVHTDGKYYIFVVTDKEAEAHREHEGDHGHEEDHDHAEKAGTTQTKPEEKVNFEKIEVLKGVSEVGYTAITWIKAVPENAKIVTKGAFFVNATLDDSSAHAH